MNCIEKEYRKDYAYDVLQFSFTAIIHDEIYTIRVSLQIAHQCGHLHDQHIFLGSQTCTCSCIVRNFDFTSDVTCHQAFSLYSPSAPEVIA